MNLSCKVSYCVAILFIGTIVSELLLSFSLPSKKAFSVNRGEFFYGYVWAVNKVWRIKCQKERRS